MKEWKFTYEKVEPTPAQKREERRQKAWQEASKETKEGCLEKLEGMVKAEEKTSAPGAWDFIFEPHREKAKELGPGEKARELGPGEKRNLGEEVKGVAIGTIVIAVLAGLFG